jgi:hypothetical protein
MEKFLLVAIRSIFMFVTQATEPEVGHMLLREIHSNRRSSLHVVPKLCKPVNYYAARDITIHT